MSVQHEEALEAGTASHEEALTPSSSTGSTLVIPVTMQPITEYSVVGDKGKGGKWRRGLMKKKHRCVQVITLV